LKKAAQYLNAFSPGNDIDLGKKNVVQSMLATFQQDLPGSIRLARKALKQLPGEETFFRQIAAWNLSASLFLDGNFGEGSAMLEEVARVSRINNNLLVTVVALTRLGSIRLQQGRLDQAQNLFEQAIETKPAGRPQPLPAACEAMMNLAKIHWERFDPDAAVPLLERGIRLSTAWSAVARIDGLATMAQNQQFQGDSQAAEKSILAANEIAVENAPTLLDNRYVALQAALLAFRNGEYARVAHWIHTEKLDEKAQNPDLDAVRQTGEKVILAYELILYARFLLVRKRPGVAISLLAKLYQTLNVLDHRIKAFEVEVLSALAYLQNGNTSEAVSAIDRTLKSAGPLGCRRVFLVEGPAMAGLLGQWQAAGCRDAFGIDLLASLNQRSRAIKDPAPKLIETLTEREKEILQLLDSELSVDEMAVLLHISTSTARTHIKNIYGKLDAHSRFEAVLKAKESELF